MGERLRAIVLAAVVWMVGGPEVARACSCSLLAEKNRFLVQTGTTLPRNALGMPWWGKVDSRFGDEDGTPARSRFTVDRLESGVARAIEFDLVVVPAKPGFSDSHGIRTWLIVPRGGLVPGARYRFRAKTPVWHAEDGTPDPLVLGDSAIEADIAVAETALDGESGEPVLDVGSVETRDVTIAMAMTCSARVWSSSRELDLRLPTGAARFGSALLYATIVDGDSWHPTTSLCAWLGTGESWLGPGHDRLFTQCPAPDQRPEWPSMRSGLEPGTHEVEMIAWLPGTPIEFRAHTTIELSCPTAAP